MTRFLTEMYPYIWRIAKNITAQIFRMHTRKYKDVDYWKIQSDCIIAFWTII